jgi:hypothetical protein
MLNPSHLAEIQKITHFYSKQSCQEGGKTPTFIAERFFLKLSFMNIICLSFGILQHPDWKIFITERYNGEQASIILHTISSLNLFA